MSNIEAPQSSPLVRKIARITAKPNRGQALSEALRDLEFATRREVGCREFAFFRALSDPDSFVLVETFENEMALELHLALPHTRRFFAVKLVENVTVAAISK
ncbi:MULTISPECIES: putative quinol monooxygenase [unclassified Hydrogenophaga]|uniref:putative quinol monooxygenase n=1 Tax=unclassified Hydrogenophaga TaxID=2610897 RepID=UPI0009EBB746|nr:putative quinol monooxygenase [Hydrogenophaga sp. Root209]